LEPQGALGDLGWYCAKWILSFYEWKMPTKVFATAIYHNNDKNSVITSCNAILWFDGDRMAQLDCSFEMAFNQMGEVVGTDGTLIVDDFVLARNPKADYTFISGGKKVVTETKEATAEVELINHFSKRVQREVSWGNQALLTQKVLDGIETSCHSGKIVEY
jgi:predicted dehydrogenase